MVESQHRVQNTEHWQASWYWRSTENTREKAAAKPTPPEQQSGRQKQKPQRVTCGRVSYAKPQAP